MHQQNRQPFSSQILRLPVAMAQHPSTIEGIDLNLASLGRKRKRLPPPVVSGQRLRMAAAQP